MIGANERLCEIGQVAFGAELAGPGVIPGVNDWALYTGNPSKGQTPQVVVRAGDPAPGLPGLTVGPDDSQSYFALEQSDNGTLLLIGVLRGPGVDASNDLALWTGPPDNLQLVYREGMSAPGTPAGTVFAWFQSTWTVNDAGQVAVLAGLAGPGITDDNNKGRWIGGPGSVSLLAWAGIPAPGMPPGVTFGSVIQTITCINNHDDMNALVELAGFGVTAANERALYVGPAGDMQIIAREGDVVPEAGEGIEIDLIGNSFMNELGQVMYVARLRGPSVSPTNEWAKFFGTYAQSSITLRNGDPAPAMSQGIIMTNAAIGLIAMNDVGHVVTVVEVTGPGITPETDTVALLRDPISKQWQPFLQGGMTLASRTVSLPEYSDLGYWWQSGGSDGYGLSLNDSGQFVVQIPFSDGMDGIFIVQQAPAPK